MSLVSFFFLSYRLLYVLLFFFCQISDYKMKLFDNLVGKAEKVLEIGIGTGPNFKYYTAIPNIYIIGVDPNAKMESYARKSATEAGLKPEEFTFVHAVNFVILIRYDIISIPLMLHFMLMCLAR